ncbi:adenosylcobinamide-phosphate synthase [Halarsenatibacter silvermanii]|uniref:Cobalamin biosynthesis protein CobD n=1 Tax=Halarsenatibacter silvermanii TaxID=321763 RepID=A0A1G9MWE1_9FIRM|nr:adenosylcobinamide-phosphate synthase [Halarsenatibacter silvermanii]
MHPLIIRFLLILAAVILDWFLADREPFTHPVVLIGRLIEWLEKKLVEEGPLERSIPAGLFITAATLIAAGGLTYFLVRITLALHPLLGAFFALYIYYTGLAAGSLAREGRKLAESLAEGRLEEARERADMLITRDAERMNEEDLSRAGIETVAENLNDAVIAPLFYGQIFGPTGVILYKAIDTLDSMLGYKNSRYIKLGRAAAKIDDLASWPPARMTAIVLVIASLMPGYSAQKSLTTLRKDARKTSSPNAGYPEAAMAGALKVRLGGPDYYFGELVEKPYLGESNRPCTPASLRRAVKLIYITEILFVLAAGSIGRFLAATPFLS